MAGFPAEIPTQAFIARALQTLNAVDSARRQAQDLAGARGSGALPSVSSAIGLASALAPPKHINVNDLLTAVNLQDIGFVLHIDQGTIDKMAAETAIAKNQKRKPSLFGDLTGKDILPSGCRQRRWEARSKKRQTATSRSPPWPG